MMSIVTLTIRKYKPVLDYFSETLKERDYFRRNATFLWINYLYVEGRKYWYGTVFSTYAHGIFPLIRQRPHGFLQIKDAKRKPSWNQTKYKSIYNFFKKCYCIKTRKYKNEKESQLIFVK